VRVGGAGVGVRVGVGVLVGSGVWVGTAVCVGVDVGVAVGLIVRASIGVTDAVTGEMAVGNTATGVAFDAGPHAANSKIPKHAAILLFRTRGLIFTLLFIRSHFT
jgi:hypothetical protein